MTLNRKYFQEGTENIVSTKELIMLATEAVGKNDDHNIANISKSLIIVKSIRKLTSSININSEKSDKIAIVGLILSFVIFFSGCVQIYIEINK